MKVIFFEAVNLQASNLSAIKSPPVQYYVKMTLLKLSTNF